MKSGNYTSMLLTGDLKGLGYISKKINDIPDYKILIKLFNKHLKGNNEKINEKVNISEYPEQIL